MEGDESKRPRKLRLTPDSDDLVEISSRTGSKNPTKRWKCSCVHKAKAGFRNKIRKFNEVSATNLKIRTGAEAGAWDGWGVYYCSNRFGQHSTFNSKYFAVASIFIIGQGTMLDLIYYMRIHGGPAFLVVLFLVYITLGYPMYIFETIMGQYSGRKPLQMLRFMIPALTGIGPALFLRTIVKAINVLSIFLYSALLVLGLFFCKPSKTTLTHRFLELELQQEKFSFFPPGTYRIHGNISQPVQHQSLYEIWWLFPFTIALLILVTQKLKLLGKLFTIVVKIFLLAIFGYTATGCIRAYEVRDKDSIVYVPLEAANIIKPNWSHLVSGQTWLDAMLFAIQALELGTLVHPYLGSKSFFHYRCHRDGFGILFLSLAWNIIGALGALAWLGYVGINAKQIIISTEHLFGHYGLFVVFMIKHEQAELTGMVQGDVLFFNAFFYSIVGLTALCALVIYIIIIVDCAYPESGQLLLKLGIMIITVSFFGIVVPMFVLQDNGLRLLIFINFYAHKTWSALFIVGCYFGAVAFGHDMGKFVHDFLNIIHIKGYQSKQHSYHVPRTLRYLILTFLSIGMLCLIFSRPYPYEGMTDWSGDAKYIGIGFSCLPLLCIFSVFLYYKTIDKENSRKPHRDWYKNKHHTSVCFYDFARFNGIKGLQDPEQY